MTHEDDRMEMLKGGLEIESNEVVAERNSNHEKRLASSSDSSWEIYTLGTIFALALVGAVWPTPRRMFDSWGGAPPRYL